MATTIALANNKGGTGKTTTTIALAHAAAAGGARVLVVDNDGQGNASTSLAGLTRATELDTPTLADVYRLTHPDPIADTIVATRRDGIDLVPSGFDAFDPVIQQINATATFTPHQILASALATVTDRYDVVLIDCPPSMGYATLNALVAADRVLILTNPDTYSHIGLTALVDTVDKINAQLRQANPIPDPEILVNAVDSRSTRREAGLVDDIRRWAAEAGVTVFGHVIPRKSIIGSTAQAGRGLDEVRDPTATYVAGLYTALLDDLRKDTQ